MDVWTVIRNKAYIFNYQALPSQFDTYLPAVNKIINSFINEPAKANAHNQSLTYENPMFGVSIKYPANWRKFPEGLASFVIVFALPKENLQLIYTSTKYRIDQPK